MHLPRACLIVLLRRRHGRSLPNRPLSSPRHFPRVTQFHACPITLPGWYSPCCSGWPSSWPRMRIAPPRRLAQRVQRSPTRSGAPGRPIARHGCTAPFSRAIRLHRRRRSFVWRRRCHGLDRPTAPWPCMRGSSAWSRQAGPVRSRGRAPWRGQRDFARRSGCSIRSPLLIPTGKRSRCFAHRCSPGLATCRLPRLGLPSGSRTMPMMTRCAPAWPARSHGTASSTRPRRSIARSRRGCRPKGRRDWRKCRPGGATCATPNSSGSLPRLRIRTIPKRGSDSRRFSGGRGAPATPTAPSRRRCACTPGTQTPFRSAPGCAPTFSRPLIPWWHTPTTVIRTGS